MMTLEEIIQGLQNADRFGEDTDEPEGARFIQLSDTLVCQMIETLKDFQRWVNR